MSNLARILLGLLFLLFGAYFLWIDVNLSFSSVSTTGYFESTHKDSRGSMNFDRYYFIDQRGVRYNSNRDILRVFGVFSFSEPSNTMRIIYDPNNPNNNTFPGINIYIVDFGSILLGVSLVFFNFLKKDKYSFVHIEDKKTLV